MKGKIPVFRQKKGIFSGFAERMLYIVTRVCNFKHDILYTTYEIRKISNFSHKNNQ